LSLHLKATARNEGLAPRLVAMARYFFHTESRTEELDHEGMELPSHQAARMEAARMLGEMLKDNAHAFWTHRALKLIVTNEAGLILFALDLSAIEAPAVGRDRVRLA
jgi:hypothetical protein